MDDFVHLHLHTHYSLLDGAARINELIAATRAAGMDTLAITDHGNLFGAVEFYTAATEAGVKPILGIEAYISPTTRTDRSMANPKTAAYHMILLAMNETGWRNLMKLSSRAYIEGFYYKPRVDRELLSEFSEGLVCTTACLGGEVPSALLEGNEDKALRIAGEYLDIFGRERFFVEVQNQGLAEQNKANPMLVALAGRIGAELVGTNDVHFLARGDKSSHEVLTCIATGKVLGQDTTVRYTPEMYLKSPPEMRKALAAWPAAADNTRKIAEMCNLSLDFRSRLMPVFPTPAGVSDDEYLADLARRGLAARFEGGNVPQEYEARLERELKVIADKGYSSYFLITNDLVHFAHSNNIPAALRGSAVATLLGYALGMSETDPLRYGLLFERFTDPERAEDPDCDIDICQDGRPKVIQYVREKYGHVAQIITYGTLKAKAAIRDVSRVLDIPLAEVDAIAKKIPEGLKVTLQSALKSEPDLNQLYDTDPRVRKMMDHAMRLEGLARHAGVNAAGVVIAQEPLENLVPLYRQADSKDLITQWDGPATDKVGLMRIDFLGLRTLTTVQRARELVQARTGKDIDPEKIPLDDDKVFELFRRAHTDGVFQFESGGMKSVLTQMQPTRIEDLIAANAMYRPGPMEFIPAYCERKHANAEAPSVHGLVNDILAETYGIMCYQEQVMQVLNRLGKVPLNRALTLIKAISKKNEDVIEAERPNFLKGAQENGIHPAEAGRLFDLILKFAGYGFNKAHSTRYAILAYQTAYFKAYHPLEFMAALLTFESGDTDKIVQYMAEAARMGLEIALPDINTCNNDFTIDAQRIRFGLAAVKGVGTKAVQAILEARKGGPFRDLFHFCEHVDLRLVNKSVIEALIKCGAFDALGAHRAAMIATVSQATDLGHTAAANRKSGQMSFLDILAPGDKDSGSGPRFPDVEPWSEAQVLAAEKETLGFYVTSHPLTHYGRELDALSSPHGVSLAGLSDFNAGATVTVGCMITRVRPTVTKSGRSAGKKMAILTVEDLTGKCDAVVFSETYETFKQHVVAQEMVFLSGTVDRRREKPNIVVGALIPIDKGIEELTGSILLRLPLSDTTEPLDKLLGLLQAHHGRCPV
ncbi:MAG: DNA polymerase III subunit alpha, partial [Phycisphaerae bacterium]|nr:DNA polymerase III subunit alpha [Phycisphaerae bacterium]